MKPPKTPQRICVDMDEVMADAIAEHLLRYNRDYNGNITKADLQGKHIWDVVPSRNYPRLSSPSSIPKLL
jgi:5'(3')-deoxyribonucleotidase